MNKTHRFFSYINAALVLIIFYNQIDQIKGDSDVSYLIESSNPHTSYSYSINFECNIEKLRGRTNIFKWYKQSMWKKCFDY